MLVLREDKNKIAVLGWGRFNPPTKGHQLLGQFVRDKAAEVGGIPMIYSSHTYKNKKDSNGLWGDPLPYEEKAKWLKKVFGDMFVESDLKTVIQILTDLYKQGYNELYFIAGSDRIEEYKKMLAYNGQPSKKTGEIPFNFDRVEIIPAGEKRQDNAEGVASISGTKTRKLAFDGDLEGFKKAVPFDDADAEELYNTLRTELGAVDDINEDLTNTSNVISFRPGLVKLINKYLNPMAEVQQFRHPDEICRLRFKSSSKVADSDKEDLLKSYAEEIINDIKQDLIKGPIELKKNYFLTDINLIGYKNYHNEANVSDKYNAYKVEYNFYATGDEDNIQSKINYIIINPGKIKSAVANKIMGTINHVKFTDMYQHVATNSFDKELYVDLLKEAADKNNVKAIGSLQGLLFDGDFKFDFTISEDLRQKLLAANNRSNIIDFSEVYGSVAFANAISQIVESGGEDTFITFPSGSNEGIYDYIIVNRDRSIKISAKVNEGGSPSSSTLVESIIKYFDGVKIPDEYADGFEFAKWLYTNMAKVGTQEGFNNLKNLLINLSQGNKPGSWCNKLDVPDTPALDKAINFNIKNKDDIDQFRNLCNQVVKITGGQKFGSLKDETLEKAIANDSTELYFNTVKIKGLSTIMLNIFNNSELRNELNELFRLSFGAMVQVHLIDPKLDTSGVFSFYTQTTASSQYKFINNTGIDSGTFILGNQRLAMKLKK